MLADSDFDISILDSIIALPNVEELAISQWVSECVDPPMSIRTANSPPIVVLRPWVDNVSQSRFVYTKPLIADTSGKLAPLTVRTQFAPCVRIVWIAHFCSPHG